MLEKEPNKALEPTEYHDFLQEIEYGKENNQNVNELVALGLGVKPALILEKTSFLTEAKKETIQAALSRIGRETKVYGDFIVSPQLIQERLERDRMGYQLFC